MGKAEQDVLDASAALAEAVIAARAAGYRVTFETSGGDPVPVLNGGPEPVALAAPQVAVPETFGTAAKQSPSKDD